MLPHKNSQGTKLSSCVKSPYVVHRTVARIAANVRAAWRRRGVRYSSCGTQTFIFPLHFLRRYTPACAKPPVVRSVIFRECCLWLILLNFRAALLFRVVPLSRHDYLFLLRFRGVIIFQAVLISQYFSGCTTFSARLPFLLRFRGVINFQTVLISRYFFGLYNSLGATTFFYFVFEV